MCAKRNYAFIAVTSKGILQSQGSQGYSCYTDKLRGKDRTQFGRIPRRVLTFCKTSQSQNNGRPAELVQSVSTVTKAPSGKRSLSAEFLAVVGAMATVLGVFTVVPALGGITPVSLFQHPGIRQACTTLSSFFYGIVLSRFDLRKGESLRLTIAFSLLMRFICMPVLSHAVSIAGYAVAKLTSSKTAAVAAAAAITAPETVKATAASFSLPSGVLSSLFLLSTTPIGLSPCAAMLSMHIHPTLLAILIALTISLSPAIPCISHVISQWAHRSAFLNVGSILPQVAPPPNIQQLLLATSLPFFCGLGLSKLLPRRVAAICGFVSLPLSWLCSLLLLCLAVSDVVGGSVTGLAGSIALCAGVVLLMFILSRALGSGLRLDIRAKRTLTLYLCTQGTIVSAGIAPPAFAAAPHIASAFVGIIFAATMGKMWSHVIVKTSTDVIL